VRRLPIRAGGDGELPEQGFVRPVHVSGERSALPIARRADAVPRRSGVSGLDRHAASQHAVGRRRPASGSRVGRRPSANCPASGWLCRRQPPRQRRFRRSRLLVPHPPNSVMRAADKATAEDLGGGRGPHGGADVRPIACQRDRVPRRHQPFPRRLLRVRRRGLLDRDGALRFRGLSRSVRRVLLMDWLAALLLAPGRQDSRKVAPDRPHGKNVLYNVTSIHLVRSLP
jgi:hypothetical protein